MVSLELKVSPTHYDEYGQPCYPVGQEKGLIEFQENRLIKQALANGYTATVATTLFDIIGRQVALASLRGPGYLHDDVRPFHTPLVASLVARV
jgi:hypothetical protein